MSDDYTAEEIAAAYRRAKLRYKGISLFKAINTPLVYRSLCRMADVERKKSQTAPEKEAA